MLSNLITVNYIINYDNNKQTIIRYLTIKNCDKTFRKSILKFVDDVSTFG